MPIQFFEVPDSDFGAVFAERADGEMSVRIWASRADYQARKSPMQGLSWSKIEHSRKFFANASVVDPAPELDPIPQPSEADIAKADLAATDAGMVRVIDDLVVWAKANGWTPPAAVQTKIDVRAALRSKIQ